MPRSFAATTSGLFLRTALEVTTLLCEATFVRDKLSLLGQASRALTRARILVRIAQRLRLLSIAQREYFVAQSLEIGKMIGGWTRAVQAR